MSDSPFDLSGRVIWITGAGRGLGRAITIALAGSGARVAVSARTGPDLSDLAELLSARGSAVDVYPLSVADPGAVAKAAKNIVSSTGRLDGLVNCAGISPSFARSEDLSDATWASILEVNLSGTFFCCREAGRYMLKARRGSIVNVSSVHGMTGFERLAAYGASKGGIEALTRTLAVEWADRDVRVNSLAPGYFVTGLSQPLLESRWSDRVTRRIPMARIGSAEEVGGAVVFLMSDAATYVTGSTLTVDGGWTAW